MVLFLVGTRRLLVSATVSPLAWIISLPIRAYRLIGSPWVGRNCRFQPTCSEYALDALRIHVAFRGSWLAARRILSCHPGGGDGFDPVPEPKPKPGAEGSE